MENQDYYYGQFLSDPGLGRSSQSSTSYAEPEPQKKLTRREVLTASIEKMRLNPTSTASAKAVFPTHFPRENDTACCSEIVSAAGAAPNGAQIPYSMGQVVEGITSKAGNLTMAEDDKESASRLESHRWYQKTHIGKKNAGSPKTVSTDAGSKSIAMHDDAIQEFEAFLGSLNLDQVQTTTQDFFEQQNPLKKPIYTNEELIGILDETSAPSETGRNKRLSNCGNARKPTEILELSTASQRTASQHQASTPHSVVYKLRESLKLCERPSTASLMVVVERLKNKDIESWTSGTKIKSNEEQPANSKEAGETRENEGHLEMTVEERKALKLERAQRLMKLIEDKRQKEEKQRKRERSVNAKRKWRSDKEEISSKRAKREENRQKGKHHDAPQKSKQRNKKQSKFRRVLENSLESSDDDRSESPFEDRSESPFEDRPESPVENPLQVPAVTIKTEVIDLTCDSSSLYVNLRFSTVNVVNFSLESCEEICAAVYQNSTIKQVEEYLAEAATVVPTFGTQSIGYLLSEWDFAKILGASVRYYHVLNRSSVVLTAQFLQELEGNIGPAELNAEVDEFSRHFQNRLANIGEKLCQKLVKVEVKNFKFISILQCVSSQLSQDHPPILLTENMIWHRLAAMLKLSRVATSSKTFEHFFKEASQPPDLFGSPEVVFPNREIVTDENTACSFSDVIHEEQEFKFSLK